MSGYKESSEVRLVIQAVTDTTDFIQATGIPPEFLGLRNKEHLGTCADADVSVLNMGSLKPLVVDSREPHIVHCDNGLYFLS